MFDLINKLRIKDNKRKFIKVLIYTLSNNLFQKGAKYVFNYHATIIISFTRRKAKSNSYIKVNKKTKAYHTAINEFKNIQRSCINLIATISVKFV